MGRAAWLARRRIAVRRQDDLRPDFIGPFHRSVEIVDLEPQQDAVAVRPSVGIADHTVFVLNVPGMKLEDQVPIESAAVHQ